MIADVVSIVGNVNTTIGIAKATNSALTVQKTSFSMIKAGSFFMDTYYLTYPFATGRYIKQAKTWFRTIDAIGFLADKTPKVLEFFNE